MILKGLSFGLKEGRCFGLLGVNGAGKSTFFKILTGATGAAHGEVLICRDGQTIDLLKAKGVGRSKLVGYCPQSDALLPKLTVVEQLQIYGVLKGMGKADIATSITTLVTSLGLRKFQDKQIGSLSGGNRRKVSVAVSLLGEPARFYWTSPPRALTRPHGGPYGMPSLTAPWTRPWCSLRTAWRSARPCATTSD